MIQLVTPKATDSLETWLSYLEKSHFKPIDMGLERIRDVAQHLDILKPAPYVITVAGTNGKGSTCKFIETALLKAGLRVGVYSSPHLLVYNERIRIQGNSVSDEDLISTFNEIEQNKSQSLTYFEFGTLAAFHLFKQHQVDVAILEVGLGGRLDATNIVDADFAVITSIDIDHVEFLGDNREDIGREKAGIFRENIPVVIGEPDCPQSILEQASILNCRVSQRDVDWSYSIKQDELYWQSKAQQVILPMPHIPIPNTATALTVLTQLPFDISDEILQETAKIAAMPGRFQQLQDQDFAKFSHNRPLAKVIVDVGHNPHAARYLAAQLTHLKSHKKHIYAVFSALVDKDISGIVKPLTDIIDEWHCAGLTGYRGQSGTDVYNKLIHELPSAKAYQYERVEDASLVLFEKTTENDAIIVFGSFHTVADFMLWINH
ncbi:bifunctional folylpolyglutamate synthase/dihydrofolate synthase [Otariodibacter oris]|uniref:Dihydrofolate synthase/folylpolyglutamate synthase n=2 Tax=Otariodibacter oris TaxID=1032623 RepID=A0A420XI54_9PAST|nr:bifunctional tetrahydrofolate synthase/dihydrofolate synthase [Otariodibacter oris]QGM80805.1 bifunctional folylpolyglutamate synthase/dihydrofolate synthase [Otariodibacter oris]RKR77025.1 dihydrofolate synthase/folylpolyglutamate synthase [Otariodibacter oris]